MPGLAPLTPARHVPLVLVICPFLASSAVSSPKYQTLPCLSWLYHSVVRSPKYPLRYRRSSITTHGAPSITLILCVTVITSREGCPSLTPRNTYVVPAMSGYHGLSTRALKSAAFGTGGVALKAKPPAEAASAITVLTRARAATELLDGRASIAASRRDRQPNNAGPTLIRVSARR